MKTLKTSIHIILFALLTFITSCNNLTNPGPTQGHPYGPGMGKIVMWSSATNIVYPIQFHMDDSHGNFVSSRLFNDKLDKMTLTAPECTTALDDSKDEALPYIDSAGTYTWTAKDQSGFTWSGTCTIIADVCHTQLLSGGCQIIAGDYKKTADNNIKNSTGVIVHWDGISGTITSNPGNSCLNIGTKLWQVNNISGCTLQYLEMNPDCTNKGLYDVCPIKFPGYVDGADTKFEIDITLPGSQSSDLWEKQ